MKTVFGHQKFREGQKEVIQNLIMKKNTLAIFPTGAGKSICFQLASKIFKGLVIVVAPLLSLIQDQVDSMSNMPLTVRRYDSTLKKHEKDMIINELVKSKVNILYVSPEGLGNTLLRDIIAKHNRVSLVAVDEAHCVDEWGPFFRVNYMKLAKNIKLVNAERVLLLTATTQDHTVKVFRETFNIAEVVKTEFLRKNLQIIINQKPNHSKEILEDIINNLEMRYPGLTLIYVIRRRDAEEVANVLQEKGFKVMGYHGGMPYEKRKTVQEWFGKSVDGIVVATTAFGMGINIPNIRYVYHYHIPMTVQTYTQQIGRGGRDGQPTICEAYFNQDSVSIAKTLIFCIFDLFFYF
uniref:DNA 3'-5' helicase n=1 Tax=Arcella intermedia TaxID=1963864 RepID=A0A6B2L8T0_9EUKA